MIVYGDPVFPASLRALVSRVALAAREAGGDLDAARFALIACGQLEQAVADAGGLERVRQAVEAASDALADAFTAARAGNLGLAAELSSRANLVLATARAPDLTVSVKQPEGYAFYTLFPEQYVEAAEEWLARGRSTAGEAVLVLGVRSIGTSLSAVVAATLRRAGLQVRRATLRPSGHPFNREARPPDLPAGPWSALVVDEGPGLSGSSMASVARALMAGGVDPERIAFLPGHGGEPGHAASEETRTIWRTTARHTVPLERLTWEARILGAELAARGEALVGAYAMGVRDVGGGAWREEAFRDRSCWPGVAPAFERAKFLVRHEDGRTVLWKFEGLGLAPDLSGSTATRTAEKLAFLADAGWVPRPIGTHLGFVVTPWLEGERASANYEACGPLVGRYVAEAAGRQLSGEAAAAGFERLAEMLYWNAHEAIGQEQADEARRLADAARPWLDESDHRAYGDGRLDPHEWVRLASGRLLKTDAAGHDYDHTVVGPQTVAWDLAGALVEWRDRRGVLEGYAAAGGVRPAPPLLRFHEAAYAAFRLGLSMMALDSASDREEMARLGAATQRYRAALERAFGDGPRWEEA